MATVSLNEPSSPALSPADDLTPSEDFLEVNPHIHLSERDSQLFADLMEADEEPVEALLQAAREYKQKINRQSL
jgi:uncharacterized protein (DUF1778 family)